jgi:hypothetical protein
MPRSAACFRSRARPGAEAPLAPPRRGLEDTVNLLGVIVALLLPGGGVWLMFELDRARKAQDCLSSTIRHCRQIRAP